MTERISQFPNVNHGLFNEQSDQTVAAQYIEQIEGEVQMDAYVKAQTSAPQVVKRISELENCIWRLCDELSRFDEHNRVLVEAALVLKNRLEVDPEALAFILSLEKDHETRGPARHGFSACSTGTKPAALIHIRQFQKKKGFRLEYRKPL